MQGNMPLALKPNEDRSDAEQTEKPRKPSSASPVSIRSPSRKSVIDGGSSTHAFSMSTQTQSQETVHDGMTANDSVPTVDSSSGSISSDSSGSPNVREVDVCESTPVSGITLLPRTSMNKELDKIRVLESKRVALRHQRFSLEQRLYQFCGSKPSDSNDNDGDERGEDNNDDDSDPADIENSRERYVVDLKWTNPASGISMTYSGPVNLLNEPHGKEGLVRFADGQTYSGSIRNGMRDGKGTNRWPDGQAYTGEWKANSRNGRGTHTWPDGRQATGSWTDGHLNGKVYFTWPNGATFDGTCKMGKKHGRGIHTWADGRVYSGNFENGKENGFGTLTCPDGVKFRGQFKNGLKHGYGIQLWRTRTYDGEWENNKPHGQGRVVWSNGSTYTGRFANGKYHGLGVYIWPSGKKFVGRWQDGVKNGHGMYTWPSGKKYDGEYRNGVKHGYGRMQWADGQIYCGSWLRNVRHGRGVQTAADGSIIYCGQWGNDIPLDEHSNQTPSDDEMRSIAEIRSSIPTHISMTSRPASRAQETIQAIDTVMQAWGTKKGEGDDKVDDLEESVEMTEEKLKDENSVASKLSCQPDSSSIARRDSCTQERSSSGVGSVASQTRLVV